MNKIAEPRIAAESHLLPDHRGRRNPEPNLPHNCLAGRVRVTCAMIRGCPHMRSARRSGRS
jgi:hypothetical protein